MMEFLTVTFHHELPLGRRRTDFERVFIQAVFSKEKLESLKQRFNVGLESISHVSSVRIYKHQKTNLSTRAMPILTLPITLDKEIELLNHSFKN